MSEQKTEEKPKEDKEKPKIFVREWKIEPCEWREATKEETKELMKDPFWHFREFRHRMRRFFNKLDEALEELWS